MLSRVSWLFTKCFVLLLTALFVYFSPVGFCKDILPFKTSSFRFYLLHFHTHNMLHVLYSKSGSPCLTHHQLLAFAAGIACCFAYLGFECFVDPPFCPFISLYVFSKLLLSGLLQGRLYGRENGRLMGNKEDTKNRRNGKERRKVRKQDTASLFI